MTKNDHKSPSQFLAARWRGILFLEPSNIPICSGWLVMWRLLHKPVLYFAFVRTLSALGWRGQESKSHLQFDLICSSLLICSVLVFILLTGYYIIRYYGAIHLLTLVKCIFLYRASLFLFILGTLLVYFNKHYSTCKIAHSQHFRFHSYTRAKSRFCGCDHYSNILRPRFNESNAGAHSGQQGDLPEVRDAARAPHQRGDRDPL